MPVRLIFSEDGQASGLEPAPIVRLQNWFEHPYDNSVATARTCYSSKVIYPEDVSKDEKARELRDKIGASTYKAGHHTTIQHPTFQFVLERVSRQFIWSFLHAHPFYNSEQVSQRYVKVKRPRSWRQQPWADDTITASFPSIRDHSNLATGGRSGTSNQRLYWKPSRRPRMATIYRPGERVVFSDPAHGSIHGTVRSLLEQPGWCRVLFDRPIFNNSIIEVVPEEKLRRLSLLEQIAEAADGRNTD